MISYLQIYLMKESLLADKDNWIHVTRDTQWFNDFLSEPHSLFDNWSDSEVYAHGEGYIVKEYHSRLSLEDIFQYHRLQNFLASQKWGNWISILGLGYDIVFHNWHVYTRVERVKWTNLRICVEKWLIKPEDCLNLTNRATEYIARLLSLNQEFWLLRIDIQPENVIFQEWWKLVVTDLAWSIHFVLLRSNLKTRELQERIRRATNNFAKITKFVDWLDTK